ncbi:trehalose operon repressor TreR [Rodentibacter caecimuris]|uniref:Trehalose operon repressor n=1 Tax=Rodentibacter caecimuris TaxID=1796644 RepID=A0ABX3KZD5_9PAST|nr:trehalose operon repressor [Rodentibacter heylii]
MTKLTIKDIALLSGVSKSTVSRVLNNDPLVGKKTRQKVEKIIMNYGFQPSKSARALRGIANRSIGIIVSRLSSTAENQVLTAMLPLLYAECCEPIIVESQFQSGLVKEHLDFFAQRSVDAVILFAFSGLDETLLQDWQHKIVVIAKHYSAFSSVYYNDSKAVVLLMEYLYQKHHRHISYLGVQDQDYTTGYLRHQAYLNFCRQHQLTVCSVQGELGYDWAYQNISAVISDDVSAVLCATDTQAIGVVRYLHEYQLRHIQVCGIGNNPMLRFLFPNILSVDLGFKEAGKIAVTQLFALWENQSVQHHCLDCRLVE